MKCDFHTVPFALPFTTLRRRLSVSVGLWKVGFAQERNTFTAPFSFSIIRNSIPSKWVFRISQQSLKMFLRAPLLSHAGFPSSLQFTVYTHILKLLLLSPTVLVKEYVFFNLLLWLLWSLQGKKKLCFPLNLLFSLCIRASATYVTG